jgi:hypothetical protein
MTRVKREFAFGLKKGIIALDRMIHSFGLWSLEKIPSLI